MADERLALTATPTTITEALDMSAALSGESDDHMWNDNESYDGVEYQSAEELVETIQERKVALEEFGRQLIAAMPADLPASRADAQTQAQLDMIVLREQITRTLIGGPNSRSNIDVILDPSASNPDDGIERYQRIVEEQHDEIRTLYDTDDEQAAGNATQYLTLQRRAYNTLESKLDQLDAIRSTIAAANGNRTPMSREEWAKISNIDLPAENMSDIQQAAGLNKFYANLEQQSVAVSFIEMEAKQISLRSRAQTMLATGDTDGAARTEARADALQIIIDRKADVLQLIQDSVTAGNGKQTIIRGMDASEQSSAAIMLQAQQKDYAIIDHASTTLRRIYESNAPADRDALLSIISATGKPETIDQAKLYAQWNVNFTIESRDQAEALFTEMEAKIQQLEQDATSLAAADPAAAENARQLAIGLNTVLVKKNDIMGMLQDNVQTVTNKQTSIDNLNSERHLDTALISLDEQKTSLETTDHVVFALRSMIDSDRPATRADTLGLLLDNGQIETIAQAKTVSTWNIETARTELDQANTYYTQLEALQQQFTDLEASYADPSLAEDLKRIQERSAELQTILDDKDSALAKINTSIETMETRRDAILALPGDGTKFALAQTLLTQQQGQLSAISGVVNLAGQNATNYQTAYTNGGKTDGTSITTGETAVPSQAAPAAPTVDPVAGTGLPNRSTNQTNRNRNGANNMQTTEATQIAALKADAVALIGFIPSGSGGEKELSTGDKVKFGTNSVVEIASNSYEHMKTLTEEAVKLRDALASQGNTTDADSITRVLDELNRMRDEAFGIGQGLSDLNKTAQDLQTEISQSSDINFINAKLVELRQVNMDMENIAMNQFQPNKEAFDKIIENNTVMNQQLNNDISIGGFARTHLGEVGRRLFGPGDGGPSVLGDAGHSIMNTFNSVKDWWTKDVAAEHGNSTWYMLANVGGVAALAAAGLSLWNNTGGKLTGFQLTGIWKFAAVGIAALVAMNGSNPADAYENRRATQAAFADRGNGNNSFAAQGNGTVSQLPNGTFGVRNQQTDETTGTQTVPTPAGAGTTVNQSGNMTFQGLGNRTVSQGTGNTPDDMSTAASVVNTDNTGALEATTPTPVPLATNTPAATTATTQ